MIKSMTKGQKASQGDSNKTYKFGSPSQQLLKRQREWVYLAHFLALTHLHPIKTISGQDDGQEPDFTCAFRHYSRDKPYMVGIELTTLPRLRDRLGNDNLMMKRWYWQSMLQVSTRFMPTVMDKTGNVVSPNNQTNAQWHEKIRPVMTWQSDLIPSNSTLPRRQQLNLSNRLQQGIAKTMRWLPSAFFEDMTEDFDLPIDSVISQADIDAVMQKKAHKIAAYQQKRELDEVWLLIHTNEAQENGVLSFDSEQTLTHHSDFNRVFVTLYPNNSLLQLPR